MTPNLYFIIDCIKYIYNVVYALETEEAVERCTNYRNKGIETLLLFLHTIWKIYHRYMHTRNNKKKKKN
jgi:hypothetical protein